MTHVKRIPTKAWDRYKKIINDFIDTDAGKQPFLWLRKISQMSPFGEDLRRYTVVKLEGLFQYNFIRTWPANRDSISGELEGENLVLYISSRLLRDNGYIDEFGYPAINWSEDRFILNGKVYKPDGDTQVAQAHDEALLFFVILKREEPEEFTQIMESEIVGVEITKSTGLEYHTEFSGKILSKEVNNILNT